VFRVEPVAPLLHRHLRDGGDVIVEGTQGFGLSLLHGTEYPYVTARDTNASGFASEAGLSPRHIDEITLVIRTYPIRVGGNSGPLADEISWGEISELAQAPATFPEYTSVTGRLRRVAKFNIDNVRLACDYNKPTSLAIMGIDRIDHANMGATRTEDLTPKAKSFLALVEQRTGTRVELVGNGFSMDDIFEIAVPSAASTNGYRAAAYATPQS
jgi:adenylosuccinate synthase